MLEVCVIPMLEVCVIEGQTQTEKVQETVKYFDRTSLVIYTYTHTHTHTHMCVCVRVCVCI